MEAQQTWPIPQDNTLLIVDDDRAFLARLARAMETRGFEVETAPTVAGRTFLASPPPAGLCRGRHASRRRQRHRRDRGAEGRAA